MVKSKQQATNRTNGRRPAKVLRQSLSYLLLVLAIISCVTLIGARYIQNQLLSTSHFIAITGPLPNQPAVKTALGQYFSNALFDNTTAVAKLQTFLPPALAPLAQPLSLQLKTGVDKSIQTIISSDTFTNVWITTMETVHSRLIAIANQPPASTDSQTRVQAIVRVTNLLAKLRQNLAGKQPLLSSQQKDQLLSIPVNLKLKANQLRYVVKDVNGIAKVIPYVIVALALAGLALAYNRWRASMTAGGLAILAAATALIIFKIISAEQMSRIDDPVYQSAGTAIYQAFYAPLRSQFGWLMAIGGLISAGSLLFAPYAWAKKLRINLKIDRFTKTTTYTFLKSIRRLANQNYTWVVLAIVAVGVIWMLSVTNLLIGTFLIAVSVMTGLVAIYHLIARPAPISTH